MQAITSLKFLTGIAIVLSFFYSTAVFVDPDLGWHLKVGEQIQTTGLVPHLDSFSHTMPGHEWVDHEWFLDFLMWSAWERDLWWLVVLAFTAFASLPFLVWVLRASSPLHIMLQLVVASAALSYFGVRPHVLSFFFFSIVLDGLGRFYGDELREGTGWRRLALMPLLFFVWANLHGGFVSGLALFALYIAVHYAKEARRYPTGSKATRRGVRAFLASVAVTLVNPYGFTIYGEVFSVLASKETATYILEWKSPLVFGALTTSLVVGMFLVLLFLFYRRVAPSIAVPPAMFLVSFLRSAKVGPVFFAALLPFFNEAASHAANHVREAWRLHPPSSLFRTRFRIVSMILFVLTLFLLGYVASQSHNRDTFVPARATAFIQEQAAHGVPVRLFNEYAWGGYLVLHAPETPVFIDGRMPHWIAQDGTSAMDDYVTTFFPEGGEGDYGAWKEIFRRRGINTVLIRQVEENAPQEEKGWWGEFLERIARADIVEPLLMRIVNKDEALERQANNLKDRLLRAGWALAYEDEQAVVMRCEGAACTK